MKKLIELLNAGLGDEIIAYYKGRAITVREAIDLARRDPEFANYLKRIGVDPSSLTEEQWQLALMKWRMKPRYLKYYFKGRVYTVDEIIREIEMRTPVGEYFAKMELAILW